MSLPPQFDRPGWNRPASGAESGSSDASEDFPGELTGSESISMLDWPRIFRERIERRGPPTDSYRWIALFTVLAGLFASGITITILGNSLPRISRDLHTDNSTGTWVLTAQLLTLAVLMPLMGKLGDTRGHRKVYLIGFAVFTLMAIPTASAPNFATLVVFRVVGSAGGAATGPASMAIIMHSFRGDDRVRAIGWWQLVGAGAPVIGLAAGGPIVEAFGWRWIFVGQGVISLVALVAGYVVLRETPIKASGKFDVAGSAALAVGVTCLLLGMQLLQKQGANGVTLSLLAVAPIVLTMFVRIESRAVEPLLPLRFFKARNFTASLIAQFGANFAYMGSFIISPLFVQTRFGYSVSQSAATMALRPLTFSIVAPFAGYMAVKHGERLMSMLGAAMIAFGLAAFVGAAQFHAVPLVFAGLVLAGIGMGTASPSLISAVGNTVADSELGTANAAQAMIGQVGVVVGMGVMATVRATGNGDGPFALAYLCGLALALVAFAASSLVRRRPVSA